MILTEALFAPTVPSEPSPKKTAWTSPAGRAVPELGVDRQAQVGHVVVDPDREVALRSSPRELLEDRLDHRRGHLLR